MQRLVDIEDDRIGTALGSAPEQLAGRSRLIGWEVEQQLLDLAAEVVLEVEASPSDAVLERRRTVIDQSALEREID